MNSGINYILFHQLLEQTSSRLSPDVSNIINIYITQQKWYSTFYENMSKSLSPKPRQNHGTQGIFHPIPELPQEWHEHPLHKELLQRRCFDLSDGWKGCFWWSLVILYYLYICCFFFTCFLSSDVIHLFFNISQHQILLLVKHTPKEIQQTRFTRCSMIAVPSSTELPAAMDSAFRSANHWPPNPVAFSGVGSTPFEVPKWPLMEVVPKSRLVFPPEKN